MKTTLNGKVKLIKNRQKIERTEDNQEHIIGSQDKPILRWLKMTKTKKKNKMNTFLY